MEATTTRYRESTKSMQADPEVSHIGGTTSESSFRVAFPITSARCAEDASDDLDWVPAYENASVPEEMATLCRGCVSRQQCLLWALATEEVGYWAATTTRDRRQMRSLGQASVDTADWLQSHYIAAPHAPGEGSLKHYKRSKCRCSECRQANADAKQRERAARAQRTCSR